MTHRKLVRSVLVCLLTAAFASPLHAAAVRNGASQTAITAVARGSAVAYDSVNKVYLVVSAHGVLNGRFVLADGTPTGTQFPIQGSTAFAAFPRVAFSPDANGGAGAFLVTWNESAVPISIHARLVAYTAGGPIGADRVIGGDGYFESAPGVAYSTTSKEFLVIWKASAANDIAGVRVDSSGQPIAAVVFPPTPDGERDPSVAYNPDDNQFLVVYSGYNNVYAFVAARRVQAGTGAVIDSGDRLTITQTGGTYITDVTYNSAIKQYLAAWYALPANASMGQVVNRDGTLSGATTVFSTRWRAYDGIGVAYNSISGTFFLVSHSSTAEDGGVELYSNGSPVDNGFIATATGAVNGSFYPRIAASTTQPDWLISTAKDFGATIAQRVTGTAGSGTAPGGGTSPSPPPPPPPTGLTPAITAAKADFSGDGKPDLIWERDDGYLSAWKMNGITLIEAVSLNPGRVSDPDWRIVGTGDLNGDGRPEIVWQHMTNGSLAAWFMVGTAVQDAVSLNPGSVGSNAWRIVAVADMNGDGKADLIWQHTDGWLAIWFMDGANLVSDTLMNPAQIGGGKWRIVGAADMNGDGKNDLIWQHADGWLSVWYMNGATMMDAAYLNPKFIAGSDWKIKGVIDINADGKPDLIWQHTQGWLSAWLMNGVNLIDAVYLNPSQVNPIWKVVGPR